jgi:hypothetical protein
MKRIDWRDRQIGDVCLSVPDPPDLLARGIIEAELAINPAAPRDFVPSHAFIVGPGSPANVTESFLGEEPGGHWVNSVAAVTLASKYDTGYRVEVWRPSVSQEYLPGALERYLEKWHVRGYGWENLLGFEYVAMVRELFNRNVANPIMHSRVCSQGVLIYLGNFVLEPWACPLTDGPALENCDPLQERLYYLANQTD